MAFRCKALVVFSSQSFTFIPSPSSVLLDAPLSLYLPPPGHPPSPLSLLPGTSPPKPPQPLIYRTSTLQHCIHSLPNAGPQGHEWPPHPWRPRALAPKTRISPPPSFPASFFFLSLLPLQALFHSSFDVLYSFGVVSFSSKSCGGHIDVRGLVIPSLPSLLCPSPSDPYSTRA
jgi:hypothetical protein